MNRQTKPVKPLDPKNKIKILGQEQRRLLAIIDYLAESNEQLDSINSILAREVNSVRTSLITIKDKIQNTKENLEFIRNMDPTWDPRWPNTPKNEGPSGS